MFPLRAFTSSAAAALSFGAIAVTLLLFAPSLRISQRNYSAVDLALSVSSFGSISLQTRLVLIGATLGGPLLMGIAIIAWAFDMPLWSIPCAASNLLILTWASSIALGTQFAYGWGLGPSFASALGGLILVVYRGCARAAETVR